MSVTYGFYNSVEHDRRYDAIQVSQMFDGMIIDGVFGSIGEAFFVESNGGMDVTVDSGRCWFNHTWTYNDAKYLLTHEQSELISDRIDAVVVEVKSSDDVRTNTIKIVKGTPSSSPVRPTLVKTATVHQYPFAYVYIPAQATSILQSNISYMVGTSECPLITAILETINIDNLLAQWQAYFMEWTATDQAEFEDWFQHLKNELDENQASNLQRQIDEINQEIAEWGLSGKATRHEAIVATNNDKWMSPLRTREAGEELSLMRTGDVIQSLNNVEAFTNGRAIALDGRTVDVVTGYPSLNNNYTLDSRLPNPVNVSDGGTGYTPQFKNGCSVNGSIFWIGMYGTEPNSLYRISPDGVRTRIRNGVWCLETCGEYVIVGGSTNGNIYVYDSNGTLIRNVSLLSGSNITVVGINVVGNDIFCLVRNSGGTIFYGYFSNNMFETYTQTLWNGNNASISGTIDQAQFPTQMCYNIQQDGNKIYVGITTGTSPTKTFTLYQSLNNGLTFTGLLSIYGTDSARGIQTSYFFVYKDYLYMQTGTHATGTNFTKFSLTGTFISQVRVAVINSYDNGIWSGMILNDVAYMLAQNNVYKVNLNTMTVTPWYIADGFPISNNSNGGGLFTKDNRLFIITMNATKLVPTYEGGTSVGYTIVIYDTLLGQSVVLYNSAYANGVGVANLGYAFEANGNIFTSVGSSTATPNGLYCIYRSRRTLPKVPYGYLKVKEVE